MRNRFYITLFTLLLMTVVTSFSVAPASAAGTPSSTWNLVQNGDFEHGTSSWNLQSAGTNGFGSAQIESGSPSSVDGGNYLHVHTEAYAQLFTGQWWKAWMRQSISLEMSEFSVLYGSVKYHPQYADGGSGGSVGIIVSIDAYDHGHYKNPNYLRHVQLDYCFSVRSWSPDTDTYKVIRMGDAQNKWVGFGDSSYPGRQVLNDAESKFTNLYPVYITAIDCYAYVHSGWTTQEYTDGYFDGIRLGDYPYVDTIRASAGPYSWSPYTNSLATAGGKVWYKWWLDLPNVLSINGYEANLRGGISKFLLTLYDTENPDYLSQGAWSKDGLVTNVFQVDFDSVPRATYWHAAVWVERPDLPGLWVMPRLGAGAIDPVLDPSQNGVRVLNGYALTVNTNWKCGATGSATLSYKQFASDITTTLTDTTTSAVVVTDLSSTASITQTPWTEANRRVTTSSSSWTVSSHSMTVDADYYLQYWSSIATSNLVSSYPTTVTVSQLGAAVSPAPTTYGTWSGWADASSRLSITDTVTATATERYHTPNNVSWTVNSYPFSKSVTYYHQWKPTVTFIGTDLSHTVTANYTLDNSATSNSGNYTKWSWWVDDGKTVSFSLETTGGTSTERRHAYGMRSFTVSSAFTSSIAYTRQYYVALNLVDHLGTVLSGSVNVTYLGDDGTGNHGIYTATATNMWGGWMDAGASKMNVTKLLSTSTLDNQWYCYNGTLYGKLRVLGTVTQSKTYRLLFFHQFRLELQLLSSQYGWKVYDDYFHVAYGDWVNASAWLWDADVDARPTKVGTFTFKWITPSGQVIHTDTLQASNCYTDAFQIPETYGEWKLQVTWSDGAAVIFNRTVSFYVYDYDVAAQAVQNGSGGDINLTIGTALTGGSTIPPYTILITVTAGSNPTAPYMKALNIVYGDGVANVTSLSTSFFTTGLGVTWIAHVRNLDSLSTHQVAFRVKVFDPVTGYVYMDRLSTKRPLSIGDEGDVSLTFTPSSSWWRNGLLRVVYTFYVYDALGGNEQATPQQDFGDGDPISWVVRGTGLGEVKAVYLVSTANPNVATATLQIPVSIITSSATARFYVAFEDCYALSTSSQVAPVVVHYVNASSILSDVEATGSGWYQEGRYAAISTPQLYYVSSSERYVFATWSGSGVTSPGNHSTTVLVDQPKTVTANWALQWLTQAQHPEGIPQGLVTITVTQNGSIHTYTLQDTWAGWVDNGTVVTIPDLVQVSAAERYHTLNVTMFPVGSSYTISGVTFIHQWIASITLDGTSQQHVVNATYTLDSMARTATGLFDLWSTWADENSTILLPADTSGSTSWERWHTYNSTAITVQGQVDETLVFVYEYFVEVSFEGGNVFATGCVPSSMWAQAGATMKISIPESPFHPKPPYYSNMTRFIFLGWKWIYLSATGQYTSYYQWVSENATTLSIEANSPVRIIAYLRTQHLVEFTPLIPVEAPFTTVPVEYTVNGTGLTGNVTSASKLSVWVDAYTNFTMPWIWTSDYSWYQVNYETTVNATSGMSLTLQYVRQANQLKDVSVVSNEFTSGAELSLNITLTTTWQNMPAEYVNVTIVIASKNTVLVDGNGLAWSNVMVQLQNNTALVTIRLPADIGNGTLTLILSPYGIVEPTTKQVVLHEAVIAQQRGGIDLTPIAVTAGLLVAFLGGSLLIRKSRRASSPRPHRNTSNATSTTATTAASFDSVPAINSLSGAGVIEFHEQKGPLLKTIIDRGSEFLSKLRSDPGMCVRHHGTRPLVIQDSEGEHVALLTYTNNSRGRGREAEGGSEARGSRSRTVKSTLVLSSRGRSGDDIMKLAEELSQLGNNRSIKLKLVSATRNRSPPPRRQNSSNSTSPPRRNPNHG